MLRAFANPEAKMRVFPVAAIFYLALFCGCAPTTAFAQFGRGTLNLGPLESGVLPGGMELPDVTGDTLDPDVEARQPGRAQALPPPDDLYDSSAKPPAKPPVKKRR